jgi:signal transduction histidine kinase
MLPNAQTGAANSISAVQQKSLAAAFTTFTEAARSLETSYAHLQAEVAGLRQQLEHANRELMRERELSRNRQALAEIGGMLAHEVRNPLAALELFGGLLSQSPEIQGENRRYLEQMISGLRMIAATVNNVLRLHADTPLDLVPLNLVDVVDATLDFIRPLAEQAGITVDSKRDLGDVRIAADPHALQQVLHNLVLNAIRFMRDGGVISITSRLVADHGKREIELSVSDTGPGIAKEQRTRIFEPGFSTRPGSVGLGLAVCQKIMQQHGGSITLADTERGATFVLRFRLQ